MKLTVIVSALFLSAVLIVTARAHGGHKLDDAQCAAVWAKVSPNGDPIPSSQAEAYVILTTILGIVGAFAATYLGQAIGWYGPAQNAGFIGAIVGAVLILLVWGFIDRRRRV
jgi:uncharacterized membrane protein YeaQ/YmgE (transglycosylase-associated protein family)